MCHWICEWTGSDPNIDCADQPPDKDPPANMCLDELTGMVPCSRLPGSSSRKCCDPTICDPSELELAERIATDRNGNLIGSPESPDRTCLAATSEDFYDTCAPAYEGHVGKMLELAVQFFGLPGARAACLAYTNGNPRCQENGRVCSVGANEAHCLQCNASGDCFHYTSHVGSDTDAGPVGGDSCHGPFCRAMEQSEQAKQKAEEERKKAEEEKKLAEDEKKRAEEEEKRAEEEKRRAEEEKKRAEEAQERARDEQERRDAEARREAAEQRRQAAQERGEAAHERREAAQRRFEDALRRQEETRQAQDLAREQGRTADGHAGSEPLPFGDHDGPTVPGDARRQNEGMNCLRLGTCPRPELPSGKRMPPLRLSRGPYGSGADEKEREGDPVSLGTGQLEDRAVDLELPAGQGTSGLHFKLERFYTSGGVTQGALGRNWAHGYEERLVPITEYYPDVESLPRHCTEALPTVHCLAHEHRGSTQIFFQDPDSLVFLPPPGSFSAIAVREGDTPSALAFELREADGTTTLFDSRGRLRRRSDANHNSLNFYYGESDADRLLAVVDPLQRVLRFSYDERGILSTVTDFAGRQVAYEYETLDDHDPLPGDVSRLLGIPDGAPVGLFPTQYRLTSVTHAAPATPSAPAREATWRYRYLPLAEALVAIRPKTGFSLPIGFAEEQCQAAQKEYSERVARDIALDHLLGNLVEVTDPKGHVVLRTTYQLDPMQDDFDRVVSQEYGKSVVEFLVGGAISLWDRLPFATPVSAESELVQILGAESVPARYTYTTRTSDVPAALWSDLRQEDEDSSLDPLDVRITATSCEDLWETHAGRVVFLRATADPGPDRPRPPAVGTLPSGILPPGAIGAKDLPGLAPRFGFSVPPAPQAPSTSPGIAPTPGMAPPPGVVAGTGLQVSEIPRFAVSIPALRKDVSRVCEWVHFQDRMGESTWYGLNFLGQSLVSARQASPDESPEWFRALQNFNLHGQLAARKETGGLVTELTYDELAKSPLSRGNLLVQRETAQDGASRSFTYAYEPLFNQPLSARDPLGHESTYVYGYQEERAALGAPFVLAELLRFGSVARRIEELAPTLRFYGTSQNRDRQIEAGSPNLIRSQAPVATLPSGARQELYALYRYNELGQVVAIEQPGGRLVEYVYFPANRPNGEPIEMSSTYTSSLALDQRAARHETGGYLQTTRHTLRQIASALELGKPATLWPTVSFTYDLIGNLTSSMDAAGHVQHIGRDGFGQAVLSIDEEGFQRRATYDANQELEWSLEGQDAGEVDRESGTARRTRRFTDREGHLVAVCAELQPGACDAELSVLVERRRTPPRDFSGALLAKMPSAVAWPLVLTTFEYDAEERLVGMTDPEGHVHTASYNTRGLPREIVSGASSDHSETLAYEYDVDGRLALVKNGVGDMTTYGYDGLGRLVQERWPNGTTVAYAYDLADRLRSERAADKNGAELSQVRYESDERDRIKEIGSRWTVPSGQLGQTGYTAEQITTIERDPFGAPWLVTDPSRARTRFDYDTLGNEIRTTDPLGNQTFRYADPFAAQVFSRVKGEGRNVTAETTLDGRGLPVLATERGGSESRSVSASYDGLGNVVTATDAQGNTSVSSYDLLGRQVAQKTPRSERGEADLTARVAYDRRGLPLLTVDPQGVTTERAYSATGRPVTEKAGERNVGVAYDAAGRVSQVTRGDGTTLGMDYSGGFLRSVHVAGAPQRILERDGLGRVTSAWQRSAGTWVGSTLVYDSLGQVLSETTQVGSSVLRTRYAYDSIGVLRGLEYPDGTQATTTTDALGRARSMTFGSARADFGWRGGALASLGVRADAASRVHLSHTTFDSLERPVTTSVLRQPTCLVVGCLADRSPLAASRLAFTEERALDPSGRIRAQVQSWQTDAGIKSARSRAVTYSGTGWLDTVAQTATEVPLGVLATNQDVEGFVGTKMPGALRTSYLRDAVGTLLSEQRSDGGVPFVAQTFAPKDHRYSGVELAGVSLSVRYEDNGHLETDGRSRFTWDMFDRLVSADTLGTNQSYQYLYDAFDRRVARISKVSGQPTLTETFALAGWETIATYRNGTLYQRAWLGPQLDQPIQVETGDRETAYPYFDIQGNVAGVLGGKKGLTVERYEYDAYGQLKVFDATGRMTCEEKGHTVCTTATSYAYNAQLRDAETGLYYYKNRYYSPALRSFLSQDPLGYVDSFNPWAYVGGDPLNYTDPFGLSAMDRGGIRTLLGMPPSPPPPNEGRGYSTYSPPDSGGGNIVEGIKRQWKEGTTADRVELLATGVGTGSSVVPYVGDYGAAASSLVVLSVKPSWSNLSNFGLDVLGALLPIVPALGTARRVEKLADAAKDAEKAADAAKDAEKAADAAKDAEKAADAAGGAPKIRNSHLAGKTHPKTGIPFDKDGFPDFSSVSKADVKINFTGSRPKDFRAANEAAGFGSTPEGFTWHHHQDGTTMQLVPTDIHKKTGHTGGFALE